MSGICVFIPTFNVDHSIVKVLDGLTDPILARLDSVLLVDNGSSDRTVPVALEWLERRGSPKFHFLRNHRNYSLGGSTIVAFDWAFARGCDYVICLHSDGQADPAELEKFFPHCDGAVDFVLGSRMMASSKVERYSWHRLAGNRFFAALQRRITGSEIDDIGAFIAFRLKTVRELPYDRLPCDMGYQAVLILSAFLRLKQVRHINLPISWGAVESSNVNPFAYGVRHLARLVRLALRARALELPEKHVLHSEALR